MQITVKKYNIYHETANTCIPCLGPEVDNDRSNKDLLGFVRSYGCQIVV